MKNSKFKTQNLKLTEKEVQHVGKLANLRLTTEEIKKFQEQLSEILAYVEILNQVEISGVAPTSQVADLENVWRKDQTRECLSQEEALSGAKNQEKGLFKTKAILSDM